MKPTEIKHTIKTVLETEGVPMSSKEIRQAIQLDGIDLDGKAFANAITVMTNDGTLEKILDEDLGKNRYRYALAQNSETKKQEAPTPPSAETEVKQTQENKESGLVFDVMSDAHGRETFRDEEEAIKRAHYLARFYRKETKIYEVQLKCYGTVKPITTTAFEPA
nr:hypothetical protein 12 [Piscirickettsiaceae bacterium]